MKKIYNIALLASLALMGATSCIHDDLDFVRGYEQNAGDLELTFVVEDSEIVTRAAQSTYYEHAVQSIYVFVFNGDKRVELPADPADDPNGNVNFFDLDEIQDEHNKQDDADTDNSHGTLKLGTVSGSNMRICAIANIGTSNSVTRAEISTAVSEQVAKFDAITTYTQLKQLVLELGAESVQRGSSFLLTGEVPGVTLEANATTRVEIPLYRTDAKVTFNVTAAAADAEFEDFKFTPQRWRVVNVPKATWALPRENLTGSTTIAIGEELDATTADDLFFDSASAVFEGKVNDTDNSGTFTFYMYENLKGAKAEAATYAMRELQQKTDVDDVEGYDPVPGQVYVNGDYVNAPDRGTYVVFSGQLSYTHKAVANGTSYDEFVMADVEYCVHLGHLSQSNFNDYKTLRNHHYTYNVTVTGVNDLIVEVENSENDPEERRPGAEGEVVMSASEVVAVDGHYDRALITLTPEEAKNILFAVKTPWERGLDTNNYYVDNDGNPTEANTWVRDYKWVKFLINKDYDIADTEFAPYPGEQCYDGGSTLEGTAVQSDAYGEAVVLRDIRQLSNYLSALSAQQTLEDDIVVTAFIDEYIYYYNPLNDPVKDNPAGTTYKGVTDLTADDTEALLFWKRSVNSSERMMHIVKKGDMNYSWDGETSLSRSVVTIQQQPIISVYNHMAQSLNTAWGSEVVNETPKMVVSRTNYNNITTTNAYTEAQTLTAGSGYTNWASVISASERYGLEDNYNDPSYACALRNRDLNGDGTINKNEVLWYLASLNQMTDMWIADPAMPSDKKLYDEDNPDGYYVKGGYTYPASHYVTSTLKGGSSPWVYWAEEYGATSTHENAIGWGQAPLSGGEAVVSLRCVRHFGLPYGSTDMPQDYITVMQPTSSADGTIDLKYINPDALRTAPDSGAALAYAHLNDVGENNRPYAGFFVDYDSQQLTTSGAMSWRQAYNGEVTGTNRVCPTGYRVPNQREMVLMTRAITDNWNSRLYVMFNGQYIKGESANNADLYLFGAFFYDAVDKRITRLRMAVENGTEVGNSSGTLYDYGTGYDNALKWVRCVKDNPDAKPDVSGSFDDEGDDW